MNALIEFSLRHRVLMVVLFIVVMTGGVIAFQQLNIEAYPDPTPPMVDVITQSPGLSAEEIERYITIPIETQTAGLRNLTSIRTISYALAGGLLATFTVTPALSAVILPEHVEETETFVVRWCHRIYEPVLHLAVANKAVVLAVVVALLVLAGITVRSLGLEFLPKLEEGNLWIRATLPSTISIDAGNEYVNRMRTMIRSFPEVESVVSQHGRPDDGTDAAGAFNAEFFAPL